MIFPAYISGFNIRSFLKDSYKERSSYETNKYKYKCMSILQSRNKYNIMVSLIKITKYKRT